MSHLTPELLFDAADRLVPAVQTEGAHYLGVSTFMCWAVDFAAGNDFHSHHPTEARREFARLLVTHDAIQGSVMRDLYPENPPETRRGSDEERQAVRFMFLEFLALEREG